MSMVKEAHIKRDATPMHIILLLSLLFPSIITQPTAAQHLGPMVISLRAHVMEAVNRTAVLVVPFTGYPQESIARLELTVQALLSPGTCVSRQDHETPGAHFQRHQFSVADLVDGKFYVGMPDLKPCRWKIQLQVHDTFPGLSEDESLLSSRTIFWQQPARTHPALPTPHNKNSSYGKWAMNEGKMGENISIKHFRIVRHPHCRTVDINTRLEWSLNFTLLYHATEPVRGDVIEHADASYAAICNRLFLRAHISVPVFDYIPAEFHPRQLNYTTLESVCKVCCPRRPRSDHKSSHQHEGSIEEKGAWLFDCAIVMKGLEHQLTVGPRQGIEVSLLSTQQHASCGIADDDLDFQVIDQTVFHRWLRAIRAPVAHTPKCWQHDEPLHRQVIVSYFLSPRHSPLPVSVLIVFTMTEEMKCARRFLASQSTALARCIEAVVQQQENEYQEW